MFVPGQKIRRAAHSGAVMPLNSVHEVDSCACNFAGEQRLFLKNIPGAWHADKFIPFEWQLGDRCFVPGLSFTGVITSINDNEIVVQWDSIGIFTHYSIPVVTLSPVLFTIEEKPPIPKSPIKMRCLN